jgi:hypothetical protein
MTSRKLVRASLDGKATPRVPAGPLVVHAAAALAGISMERYTLDPVTMVDCICRYHHEMMLKLSDDAPFVEALLDACTGHAAAYGLPPRSTSAATAPISCP